MKETIALNLKEQRRLMILNEVIGGKVTVGQAAELLQRSERQVHRLVAAYRQEGAAAVAHGNRGRQPAHTIRPEIRQQVVRLATTTYQGFNHQHLTEKLAEELAGIRLSRSTVRRVLLAARVAPARTRRSPTHRKRRERYPQEGMLLQIDASPHDWLEGRGPRLTLVAGIDDATGTVPQALFRDQEDAQGYFLLLQGVVQTRGVPVAVYHDRHSIFERTPQEPPSLAEQLAGRRAPTQFGRCLDELGIGSLAARSPQAKGRIERLFGTFQDRLVSELRLAGATTRAEAQRVLANFLPHFNAQFAVAPAEPGSAYRPLPPALKLAEVCCFTYQRTVGADNVVRLGEHRLQVLPGHGGRHSYAKATVDVHERLDGSLAVYYQGQCLTTTTAPHEAPVLRARDGRAKAAPPTRRHETPKPAAGTTTDQPSRPAAPKPRPDHPWRTLARVAAERKLPKTQEGETPAHADAPPSRSLHADSTTQAIA